MDSELTWKEYKSMTFTFQVEKNSSISLIKLDPFIPLCCPFLQTNHFNLQFINETVRLANIVPGIFRKALREIQFKGIYIQIYVVSF